MIVAIPGNKQLDRPVLERRGLKTCKKCGGKLARDYEDIACINCGALHDEEGNLLKNRILDMEKLFA
jgi:hypothetical protein